MIVQSEALPDTCSSQIEIQVDLSVVFTVTYA